MRRGRGGVPTALFGRTRLATSQPQTHRANSSATHKPAYPPCKLAQISKLKHHASILGIFFLGGTEWGGAAVPSRCPIAGGGLGARLEGLCAFVYRRPKGVTLCRAGKSPNAVDS